MKRFLLLLFIITAIAAIIFLPNYLSTASNKIPKVVQVNSGESLSSVAEKLYESEIIKSKLWFKFNGKDISRNIRPGTYTISPHLKINQIYEVLQQGQNDEQIKLTFPEGFMLYQFANKVEEAGLGTVEEFIAATNTYFKDKGYDFDTSNLYFNMEGYLFPDTYYFTKNQNVTDIVTKLTVTMEELFTEEYRARADELGLTTHEILTIASLIEREAYNDGERAKVSGVIYNRLSKGMRLQIDATVIYGVGEGKKHMQRVYYSDLEKDNPFNTYRKTGLPPGPIASPGKASIEAALYPEHHDYYYYVLGKDGHEFAITYNEHLDNVNKFQK